MTKYVIKRKVFNFFDFHKTELLYGNDIRTGISFKFRTFGGFDIYKENKKWITCSRKGEVRIDGKESGIIDCKGFAKRSKERYYIAELKIGNDTYTITEDARSLFDSKLNIKKNKNIVGSIRFRSGILAYPRLLRMEIKKEELGISFALILHYWHCIPDGFVLSTPVHFPEISSGEME